MLSPAGRSRTKSTISTSNTSKSGKPSMRSTGARRGPIGCAARRPRVIAKHSRPCVHARPRWVGLHGNTVAGNGDQRSGQGVDAQQDGVTKKGTLIYRVGASAIRDDGDKLQVSRGATPDGLAAALRMAMARYGDRITVKGSVEFKESIAHAAATANLPDHL
jgi:hypothetical protein